MAEYVNFDVHDGISVEKIDPDCRDCKDCKEMHRLTDSIVEILQVVDFDIRKRILEMAHYSVEANEKLHKQLELRHAAFLANVANANNNK